MPHPHLDNAPITEAVLEIRTALPAHAVSSSLEAFAAAVSPTYHKRRERLHVSVGFRGGAPTSGQAVVDGLLIEHASEPQIVQARLDGFAFSRLRPYQRWEALRGAAQPLWERYKETCQPTRIKRIALRFINAIEIDVESDPRTTLTLLPAVPAPLAPAGLTSFTMQLVTEHPDFGAAAQIVEHLPTVAPDARRATITLDLDVFMPLDLAPDDVRLWEHFEQLRELKNVLFFSCLTTEARKGYQHAPSSK
jgi:uncharacterized protein (TIGR04255 family)